MEIFIPVRELDNYILDFLEINNLINLIINQKTNQIITNLPIYLEIKGFYLAYQKYKSDFKNSKLDYLNHDIFDNIPVYSKYFLLACYYFNKSVINYLANKYYLIKYYSTGLYFIIIIATRDNNTNNLNHYYYKYIKPNNIILKPKIYYLKYINSKIINWLSNNPDLINLLNNIINQVLEFHAVENLDLLKYLISTKKITNLDLEQFFWVAYFVPRYDQLKYLLKYYLDINYLDGAGELEYIQYLIKKPNLNPIQKLEKYFILNNLDKIKKNIISPEICLEKAYYFSNHKIFEYIINNHNIKPETIKNIINNNYIPKNKLILNLIINKFGFINIMDISKPYIFYIQLFGTRILNYFPKQKIDPANLKELLAIKSSKIIFWITKNNPGLINREIINNLFFSISGQNLFWLINNNYYNIQDYFDRILTIKQKFFNHLKFLIKFMVKNNRWDLFEKYFGAGYIFQGASYLSKNLAQIIYKNYPGIKLNNNQKIWLF